MKGLWIALVCLAASGCQISPVVSAPLEDPSTRYSDCDRAAADYCEHAIGASEPEMDACVAKHRFQCVSKEARSAPVPFT